MELREIKGFPNYLFNAETGDIISKLQRDTHLKLRHQHNKTAPAVQMVQGERRRWIFYNRLMYAMQHGIGYDDIPDGLFITKDEHGEFKVIDKRGQIEMANNYVRAVRKRERIKRIDEKIHELEIMRRAYSPGGDHIEAVQYIESRKDLFVNHHAKRYGTSRKNAEIRYNLALEWMIDKINDPCSQVTELTVSMMGLMNKVRARLAKEQPLGLRNEKPSNSKAKNEK